MRYATVTNAPVQGGLYRYLPDNYTILGDLNDGRLVIHGEDVAGWTLDDYVIPRLASWSMLATEVTDPDEITSLLTILKEA